MNENENITVGLEEDDAFLPDGWQEGDDFFAAESWTGEEPTDEPVSDPGQEAGQQPTQGEEPAPTTEQSGAPGDNGGQPGEAPTTEPAQQPANKLKFKARVDREDRDVELDESELPTIYQKAQVTDRVQEKLAKLSPRMEKAEQLAKAMGYDSLDSMMESAGKTWRDNEVQRLVTEGVHEEVARDMVARRMEIGKEPQEGTTMPSQEAVPGQTPRDFRSEAMALLEARPDLKGKTIPNEVVRECAVNGKNLLVAYAEYEARQERAEADRLRHENEVLRQNAASAAKAPVSGTQGGGATDVKPEDDFLRGFDSGY